MYSYINLSVWHIFSNAIHIGTIITSGVSIRLIITITVCSVVSIVRGTRVRHRVRTILTYV